MEQILNPLCVCQAINSFLNKTVKRRDVLPNSIVDRFFFVLWFCSLLLDPGLPQPLSPTVPISCYCLPVPYVQEIFCVSLYIVSPSGLQLSSLPAADYLSLHNPFRYSIITHRPRQLTASSWSCGSTVYYCILAFHNICLHLS